MSANVVFNIVLTILVAWFIISRFLPVKGVKNISGKELKTEMNKKINNLLMFVHLVNLEGIIFKGFRISH